MTIYTNTVTACFSKCAVKFHFVIEILVVSPSRVVEFSSSSEMSNAIRKLDDTELGGRKIRLIEVSSGLFVSFHFNKLL